MSSPARDQRDGGVLGATPAMSPDRWRRVDAVLQSVLAAEPARRQGIIDGECRGDDALRREVESLLSAHARAGDAFLERPAAESLGAAGTPQTLAERLAAALAGRYEIVREIARGGMAVVHLARDVRHDRRVAIKVVREELAAAVGAERFLEEIRVTASLQHPHVLPLFDSGSADGMLWYVMPFAEGETLRSRLEREGRMPVDVALRFAREMADALEYAHRHGVVHRDVKPENVLLQSGHAMVADFGIALALEHAGGARLTNTGIMLGTPQYMSPEQAAGDRTIDARTDIYALGAVVHEMLAGEPPFAAPTQQAVLRRVVSERPASLTTRRADVPSSLDAAVQRALAKRPEERFASAAAFAAALGVPLNGAESDAGRAAPGGTPVPATNTTQSAVRVRRVSTRAATYAAGAMLVLGLLGGWALSRSAVLARTMSLLDRPRSQPDSRPDRADQRGALGVIGPAAAAGATSDMSLAVLDRAGRPLRVIPADRPWTPRISPDGKRVVYGAFGEGRATSDLWVMNLDDGATRRLTDDDADSNDPQWSPDGSMIAYSVSAAGGKDLMVQNADATAGTSRVLASRDGVQFPSDWLRDGSALLVTDQSSESGHDVIVQPTDGSPATAYVATDADETAARISPDGQWIAYTSDQSGQSEVYLDSYPKAGQRVAVSNGGGIHPVWRGDGRELFYWSHGALVSVRVDTRLAGGSPAIGAPTTLFRARYESGPNTMYDVTPDGQRFVIVVSGER